MNFKSLKYIFSFVVFVAAAYLGILGVYDKGTYLLVWALAILYSADNEEPSR